MSSANSPRKNRRPSSRLIGLIGAALLLPGTAFAGEPQVVGLDPRIELGEIAYWLHARPSRPKIVTPATEKYLDRLETRFEPHRGHPAVKIAGLSGGFHARSVIAITASGELPWKRKLQDFSSKADFKKFFDKNSRLYSEPIGKFRKRLARAAYLKSQEAYTGIPFDAKINIAFSPMLEAVGTTDSGADIHVKSGSGLRIHCIFSTLLLDDLGGEKLPEDIPLRLWHEAGHTMLDPLADQNIKKIINGRPKGEPQKTWTGDFKDLVTQAVTIRLFALLEGERSEARLLDYEDGRDRAFLKSLLRRLKKYEKNRKKYPTLAEFYPELLTAL